MNPVPTKIFTDKLPNGKYYLVYESAPARKEMFIIFINKKGFFKKMRGVPQELDGYYTKTYRCFSGFGAMRYWAESDCTRNNQGTFRRLKHGFVQKWCNKTYYSQYYELSYEEVMKHVLMETV